MATVPGFIMSVRWIPCPRIYASWRFRHKLDWPGDAARTPRSRGEGPTSWTTVDPGSIELLRKGLAALRWVRESESRDASVRGVGGEGGLSRSVPTGPTNRARLR